MRTPARGSAGLVPVLLLVLAGCTSGSEDPPGGPSGPSGPALPAVTASRAADADRTRGERDERADVASYDEALSTPVEDSVYPDVGDPGVDALHYDLDLTWDPDASVLSGVEELVFRVTETADDFQLDLGEGLDATSVTLDGEPAEFAHLGKDLIVTEPVEAGARHVLVVEYAGTPRVVAAPTTRGDLDTLGWTTTAGGATWTMQEPYGAFTWYAVNDQPSDKALYDITVRAPSPMVGVANGVLESRVEADGTTTTQWHLADPAASYLVTVAIGDYAVTEGRSTSGVPLSWWAPVGGTGAADGGMDDGMDGGVAGRTDGLRSLAAAVDWLEARLGPYPFDSLGVVLVDSRSGMETQTMITLGAGDDTTAPEVLVHEAAHQWYGDEVTPRDWRDVWMNEGMAMYLQGLWQAEQDGVDADVLMDRWAGFEPRERADAGPPAAYDPAAFGEGNVYYGPALMWHELRRRIGDDAFFDLVRRWPSVDADGSAGRGEYLAWIERRTGLELSSFFDAWLLGPTSPPR